MDAADLQEAASPVQVSHIELGPTSAPLPACNVPDERGRVASPNTQNAPQPHADLSTLDTALAHSQGLSKSPCASLPPREHGSGHKRRTSLAQALADEWRAATKAAEENSASNRVSSTVEGVDLHHTRSRQASDAGVTHWQLGPEPPPLPPPPPLFDPLATLSPQQPADSDSAPSTLSSDELAYFVDQRFRAEHHSQLHAETDSTRTSLAPVEQSLTSRQDSDLSQLIAPHGLDQGNIHANDRISRQSLRLAVSIPTTSGPDSLSTPTMLSPVGTPTRVGKPSLPGSPVASPRTVHASTAADDSSRAAPDSPKSVVSGQDTDSDVEDADSHPLYAVLADSPSPSLRRLWESTSLLLLPPHRKMPDLQALSASMPARASPGSSGSGFEFVRGAKGVNGEQAGRNSDKDGRTAQDERDRLEKWISWHAFKPCEGQDGSYRSIGGGSEHNYIVLTLRPETASVHVEWIGENTTPLAPDVDSSRDLRVLSETTVYRRIKPPSPIRLNDGTTLQANKSARSGFRAPKWLRRAGLGGFNTSHQSSSRLRTLEEGKVAASLASPSVNSAPLQRLRVLSVDRSPAMGEWVEHDQVATATSSPSRSSSLESGPDSPAISRVSFSDREPQRSAGMSLHRARTSQASLLSMKRLSSWDAPSITSRARAGSVTSMRSHVSNRSGAPGAQSASSIVSHRRFARDLAFLATPPPHLHDLTEAFHATLVVIKTLVTEFESSFAYIKGFDAYTLQRIRKGIYEKAWLQLHRSLHETGALGLRLLQEEAYTLQRLIENVVFGFLYKKLYSTSIAVLYEPEDEPVNHVLNLYGRERVTPAQFGFDLCDLADARVLDTAVAIMHSLDPRATTDGDLTVIRLEHALNSISGIDQACDSTLDVARVRTPLDSITIMHEAIEASVSAISTVDPGLRIAPDDLIPLLAYSIVASGVRDLESLLHYVKTYRLHMDLAPELDWSFVTFQAAVAFICSDPLNMLARQPLQAPVHASLNDGLVSHRKPALPRPSSLQTSWSSSDRSPPPSPNTSTVAFLPTNSSRTPTSALAHSRVGALGSMTSSVESSGSSHHRQSDEWSRRISTPDTDVTEMPPPSWTVVPPSLQLRRQSLPAGPTPPVGAISRNTQQGSASQGSAEAQLRAIGPTTTRPRPRHRPHSVDWSVPGSALFRSAHSSSATNLLSLQSIYVNDKSSSATSADMRRSESEGSPVASRMQQAETGRSWTLWQTDIASRGVGSRSLSPTGNNSMTRAKSPSPSFGRLSSNGSASIDEDSLWPRTGSISPSPDVHETATTEKDGYTTPTPASTKEGDALSTVTPRPLVRPRRLSASAADGRNAFAHRTLSFDRNGEPPSASSARLAALLSSSSQQRHLGSGGSGLPWPVSLTSSSASVTRPRPRSIVSVTSVSSADSGYSHKTTAFDPSLSNPDILDEPAGAGSKNNGRHSSRRSIRKSLTWRELPTSNLSGKPLAPRLDSSAVLSLPASSSSSCQDDGGDERERDDVRLEVDGPPLRRCMTEG
ncbi:hypothetical protein ACM66B_003629 [Microbotryomycetes sp. NB124-2]